MKTKIIILVAGLFCLTTSVLAATPETFTKEQFNAIQKVIQRDIDSSGRHIQVMASLLDTYGEYGLIRVTTQEDGKDVGQAQYVFSDGKYLFPDIVDPKTFGSVKDALVFKSAPAQNVEYSGLSLLYGKKGAKNIVIEVSDFECPYCRQAHRFLEPRYHGKDIAVYIMNMPLTSIHPRAMLYARIFEAAEEQGANLSEKLFNTTPDFDKKSDIEIINFFANEVKDPATFKKEVNSVYLQGKIEAQSKYAQSLGINGTPHIYFNGKPVSGFRTNLYELAMKAM